MEAKDIAKIKSKIQQYVNDTDPWHLVSMGAPEDEYNSQIDHIVSYVVNKKPNRAVLESILFTIFKTDELELEENKISKLAELIMGVIRS
ncbi:hypothetical protein A3F52_00795 [Candidatus Uhrbacteria bacterium RIFCSPHIGHO2_12_FULL_47_11]|nr:MAG: hypothetical protein A2753_02790 [Candidatus Uhrbacteria bacterium RIFCSPHIGHO2_01_FULL_47_11]OGL74583.1 MAG: hypothetical protein A3F52_00795 [Candidatus Uhrbacteria bacterium RIFCSPHIGHO2_12_FULL_47_11]